MNIHRDGHILWCPSAFGHHCVIHKSKSDTHHITPKIRWEITSINKDNTRERTSTWEYRPVLRRRLCRQGRPARVSAHWSSTQAAAVCSPVARPTREHQTGLRRRQATALWQRHATAYADRTHAPSSYARTDESLSPPTEPETMEQYNVTKCTCA